jgi:hypothetical protein
MRNVRVCFGAGANLIGAVALLTWLGATPALAQDKQHGQPKPEHHDNGQHGPPPSPPHAEHRSPAPPQHAAGPPPRRVQRVDSNDHWIGHDGGRDDAHYHVDQPWAHGHFTLGIGPSHVYHLHGGRRDRFPIGSVYFSIAPYDYDLVSDWYWDQDDLVVYDDPDHPGWYLVYNPRLGTWAHAEYLG